MFLFSSNTLLVGLTFPCVSIWVFLEGRLVVLSLRILWAVVSPSTCPHTGPSCSSLSTFYELDFSNNLNNTPSKLFLKGIPLINWYRASLTQRVLLCLVGKYLGAKLWMRKNSRSKYQVSYVGGNIIDLFFQHEFFIFPSIIFLFLHVCILCD